MRLKSFSIMISLILVITLAISGCSPSVQTNENSQKSERPKFITIGTASQGGAYYPIGIAIADIITNKLGIQANPQVTGGAVENNKLINDKSVDIAITQGPMAYAAVNGTDPYEEKLSDVQLLFNGLSKGVLQIVVNAKSDIRSIKDLKGKKVVLGPAGGGAINVINDVFAVYGMTINDIQALYISYDEGTTALTDGNADAVVVQAAIPSPAITQLTASKKDIRLLSIEDEILNEILKKYPYYSQIEISKEIYGIDPGKTIYLSNMVVINKNISEELAYEITKALFENIYTIRNSQPSAKGLSLESAVESMPIPMHPGAQKYFKEIGVLK